MQPSRNQAPFTTVNIDLIGPLPRSVRGNRYLVVMQDRFTKWVQCRPIRSPTARAASQALYEEVIARFGCPQTVISDNGTHFTGTAFKDLLEELHITHRRTPPYTPQANAVERANQTVKTMIAQYCETDHRKWDVHMADFMFALNTARHESTGFSPAFLNFGRELEVPGALSKGGEPDPLTDDTDPESVNDYSQRLRKLKEVFELVRINLARAFSTQSRHYNLRRREWRCHVGDKVMKKEHHLSNAVRGFAAKLAPKYSGPFEVTKVVSPVVYEVKSGTGRKVERVHIKDLKPAFVN